MHTIPMTLAPEGIWIIEQGGGWHDPLMRLADYGQSFWLITIRRGFLEAADPADDRGGRLARRNFEPRNLREGDRGER